MSAIKSSKNNLLTWCAAVAAITLVLATAVPSYAAVPGISSNPAGAGSSIFNLTAGATYISQPDGAQIWSWGYGCSTGSTPTFVPAGLGTCPIAQIPGPTMIVTEGTTVSVTLTNGLPAGAGNTSILFPGFQVSTSGGVAGLQTQEAPPGGTVTYTFTASGPGTYSYYSGTRPELQVEMGLYGALDRCAEQRFATARRNARRARAVRRLRRSAYAHPQACYDREYLFQFSELDARIHRAAKEQSDACAGATACPSIAVVTEPYHPQYYMVNGRSMPDLMDSPYAPGYPNQPYNGNPHMHPGDLVLMQSSARDAGSIRSTSTAITHAFWLAMEICC